MHELYFTAEVLISTFGSSLKDVWWNDHPELKPLVQHAQNLTDRLTALIRVKDLDLTLLQADANNSSHIMFRRDSMFLETETSAVDPNGDLKLYVSWTQRAGSEWTVLDILSEWDGETKAVIKQCDGVGSVTVNVHVDLNLDLPHSSSSDEFDEASNVSYLMTVHGH